MHRTNIFIPGLVPDQSAGGQSNTMRSITAANAKEAQDLYDMARHRLLDINNWHKISGDLSARFQLVAANGRIVEREAQEGDSIRINIPGPGNKAGKGFDWVKIEHIEGGADANKELAYFGLKVSPYRAPENAGPQAAHFFEKDVTSSFVITKVGNTIGAAIYGRNEKPNIKSRRVLDKVRDFITGIGAMAGLSKIQWKALVRGIVHPPAHFHKAGLFH
ncbi:hypothetical protein [Chitinophaga sp. Cy-1792]|uniref:hypothetical protein n=1 Tax=Chitinophaga sp. Cy-1792 TaxID=2608339 RepID=UPI00142059C1|nr:hypothetical protein [Chitinophaga sp. Cy-1792]NIG56375.1 hypothetical protein [Chitinophaga sp. Cy-1792]